MTVKPVTARLSQSCLVDASVLKSILKIGVLCFNKRFLYCVHNPENPYLCCSSIFYPALEQDLTRVIVGHYKVVPLQRISMVSLC